MTTRSLFFVAGLLFLAAPLIVPAPSGMTDVSWAAAGLALAMAVWWLTEALPLAATALLPIAVAPIYGIAELDTVAMSYSDPLVILFLGGFLIAKAIEKSGLHRRLAELLLRRAGTSAYRVLGSLMLSTAFLSLWISNTASAMIVAPIAAAIARSQPDPSGFGTAVMLGVAYSATIGGMGSLIGTPPNAIFAAHVEATYGVTVGFARWAVVGIPIALVLLFAAWLLICSLYPQLRNTALELTYGKDRLILQTVEVRVAIVAGLTALAWLSRPILEWLIKDMVISDAGIAVIAVLALFVISDGKEGRLLDWETAATLRWDVLILFGGGLSLANILQLSGLADWIAENLHATSNLPELVALALIAGLIVYVGELASNTAMAAIFLPIAGAMAPAFGANPEVFLLPIALAASIGFMLPVATPPNAIIFADPAVTRLDMLRAGTPLDIIALVLTVTLGSMLGSVFFG